MNRFAGAGRLLLTAIVRYSGQVVTLLLIGRIDGPLALGEFTLALALLAPLFALTSFGMRQVILTYRKLVRLIDYEIFRVGTSVLMLLALWIWSFGLEAGLADMVRVVALFKALESLMEVYQAALIAKSREISVLRWGVVLTTVQIASLLVAFSLGASVVVSLAWSYASYGIVLLGGMRPGVARVQSAAHSQSTLGSRSETFRAIFTTGLPVGVSLFLLSMLSAFPQWMLGVSGSVIDVGRFAVLSYALVAAEMILNSLSQTWLVSARIIDSERGLRLPAVLRTGATWLAIVGPLMVIGVGGIGLFSPLVFDVSFRFSILELCAFASTGLAVPFVFASANALHLKNAYRVGLACSTVALVGSLGTAGILWISVGSFGLLEAIACYGVGLILRGSASTVALFSIDRWTI